MSSIISCVSSLFFLLFFIPSLVFGQATAARMFDAAGNPITSTGGALNVSGSFSGGGDGAIVDGVSAAIKATVKDLTNSNPLMVGIVDANGDQVSVGGGTQYNQGTAATDTDALTMAGCVRADTAAVATGVADGDRTRCIVDATGKLWVNVGTVAVTGPLTDTQLRATPVPVSGTFWQATQPVSGTFWQATQPVSGTFWQATQPVSGTVTTTPPSNASTNVAQINGVTPLMGAGNTGTGSLRVTIVTDQTQLTNALKVDPSAVTSPVSIATNTPSGSVAHDGAAAAVNPLLTGCYSSAAAPTDVSADADATREWCLRNGARAVQPTFAGVLQSTGNGTAGTGTPRVTIASDNTAFAVNNTQQGTASQNVAQLAGTTTDTNSGNKSAGTLRVVLATDQPALTNKLLVTPDSVALPANQSVNAAQINGVTPLMGAGNTGTGSPRVTIATDQTTLTNTFGNVGNVPITSGGLSTTRLVSAASTNATSAKASAGQLYAVVVSNVNAAARYIHFYNTAGTPTCNASIINTFIIPGNTAGAGTNIPLFPGVAFGTGIGYCITTAADGTGNVAASEIVANIFYK